MIDQTFTVSQVNYYIKTLFMRDRLLNRVTVKGEVSNCKYHTSGHIYFTLKDEAGQVSCIMFAAQRGRLNFRLEEGQGILVTGSVRVYERDGKYQLYAEEIRLDGFGILYERFAKLKNDLHAEGLFDPSRKKKLPAYPKKIGIVTAQTGAAIRDMVNISARRNPYVQLILYPAKVQGDGAAGTIAAGLLALEAYGVDLIIVGRGGGSIEDLWAFNEESVARAIAACNVPVISAVGHETDITIADYVADLRAPTPSAAAEIAVNEVSVLLSAFVDYHSSLVTALQRKLKGFRNEAEKLELRLKHASPANLLHERRQKLLDREDMLERMIHQILRMKRHQMELYIEKLKGLSPLDKLKQGYSYVSDKHGRSVNTIHKAKPGEMLTIYVTDGRIKACVAETDQEFAPVKDAAEFP